MTYGVVKGHLAVATHHELNVRQLAGKKVTIFPETAKQVKGFGLRVDVLPIDLSNSLPVSLLAEYILMDENTIKLLEKQAQALKKSI